MATQCAQFEPVAWWWTRNKIGRDLRELYEVPKALPPKLLELVRELGTVEKDQSSRSGTRFKKLDAFEGKCLSRYAPPAEPAASVQTTIGSCVLEARLARENAMNSPLLVVIIVTALVVGSTLSIMNKACKHGYH